MSSARRILRCALELQILDPEDLRAAGYPTKDTDAVLHDPAVETWLAKPVSDAVVRFLTLSGEEAPARRATTVEPPGGGETTAPGPFGQQATRLPAGREATFAPEQASQPLGLDDARHGTFAPPREETPPSGPRAAESTFAPERARPASSLAGLPGSDRSGLLDLGALEPRDRRAIEEAAWRRIAVRTGRVTPEQAARAGGEPGAPLGERLVALGLLRPDEARAVDAEVRAGRRVCGDCLEVLAAHIAPGEPCPNCGRPWQPLPRRGRGTLFGTAEALPGFDGFPGARTTFAGYELLERVAEGGMGVVFKARQTALNRIVALKAMRGRGLASEVQRRRFLLEAEAAAGLKHQSIVPVHEISEVAGYPFYTMDFVDGLPLDDYAAKHELSPRQVSALVRNIAEAVQHFHLHGIIHRDLKPENILVGEDGVPKIIDFGIAKRIDSNTRFTLEGDVLGTLHYVSPEQAAGRVTDVDTRSDIYALGAILYHLLAGAPPWSELEPAALILAIQQGEAERIGVRNPEVDADLEAIVAKAMAKERGRRYQSAAELAADLESYERGLPIRARPATLVYRMRKAARRRLPAVIAVSVSLVFVLAGAVAAALNARATRRTVQALVAEAEDASRPWEDREASLQRALFLDPDNALARGRLEALVAQRRADARLREEQVRRRQERVEAELARERAEREANLVKARERARVEAEQRATAEATERASALLEQAAREGDELTAIRLLGDALRLVPNGQDAIRSRIEERMVELELRQTRTSLQGRQSGLANFWLQEAKKLSSARSRQAEVDALAAEIEALEHGERDLEHARALMASGDWISARMKLRQARELGSGSAEVEKDLALVDQRCAERAAALLEEGRARLSHGDAPGALAAAEEALRFAPGFSGVQELIADGETRIARDSRRRAAELFVRPEGRTSALAVLDEASRLVTAPALHASLRRERAARARLEDPTLAGLVFVPEVPDLSVEACYMERREVTNREFEAFVAAKGYDQPELWDSEAQPLLATFREGPRGWSEGGYGGAPNAELPVRGVSVYEARAFARWRSKTTGGRWRLPTDREWQIAAGWDPASSRLRAYPWGETFRASALLLGAKVPRPVGAMKDDASPLGLADAGGNVREWVERPGMEPGIKGADFAADARAATHFARVETTATPGPNPSVDVVRRIGFRLLREIDRTP